MSRGVIQEVWIGLCAVSLALPTVALPASAARGAERPNVVVMLADDQGWGDLSLNGNTNLKTPNVDSLARDGAMFERFFVSPVCSPTRAEFLTGRYHARGGVFDTSVGGERLDLDEKTIAQAFQQAGYATGAFGKWHNGSQYPYHPNARGFGEYYGFCSGHWGDYFDPPLEHNGKPVQGKGFIADDFTTRAIDFMRGQGDKPFFCYVAYCTPHSPMQVPDKFYEKFADAELEKRGGKGENLGHTRAALAMCENIDWNVGRVLEFLKQSGQEERTIVVYFCDNGPNGQRWNGGMKGVKGSTDEGGVRSPLLVRYPKKIKPGAKIEQIAGAIDLLPTLTSLCGVKPVGEKPLDGIDVSPLLLGAQTQWPDRRIFSHWDGRTSLRTQRWRLDNQGALFDMQADGGQTKDVAKTFPGVVKELQAEMDEWRGTTLAELTFKPRPYTVGYAEFPRTPLPARDAVPHGGIQRSARAPNCSFLTNWTSRDESITWDIEVHTPGRYEVEALYTCPAKDVGSTVELSAGKHKLRSKIDTPHDPPLEGAADDRVTRRGESYVKDFKAMKLGVIELGAGRQTLTMKAVEIPGSMVMDLRQVNLTLVDGKKEAAGK